MSRRKSNWTSQYKGKENITNFYSFLAKEYQNKEPIEIENNESAKDTAIAENVQTSILMLSEELPSLTGSNEIERIEIAEEANIEQSVKSPVMTISENIASVAYSPATNKEIFVVKNQQKCSQKCLKKITSLQKELNDLKQSSIRQKNTIKLLERVNASKDIQILELKREMTAIAHRARFASGGQEAAPQDSLAKYASILGQDEISMLENIDRNGSFDATFLRFLLKYMIPEVTEYKYTLNTLKKEYYSKWVLLNEIFTQRISFATSTDTEFARRTAEARISACISKILYRFGQKKELIDIEYIDCNEEDIELMNM